MKDALENIFLFREVDFAEADKALSISDRCIREIYDDCREIITGDFLCVVESGSVRMEAGRGGHTVILNRAGAGEVFGAAYLFAGSAHFTGVISEGASIIKLPRSLITDIIERIPKTAENYLTFLSGKIDFLNKKIAAFTAGSAEARLSVYLLGFNESNVRQGSMTRLANSLGIGRASLYRAVEVLEKNGAVEYDGGRFIISNRRILEEMLMQ